MISIRRAFAGIGGLVLLFTATSTAGATPAAPRGEHPACASGFRGQPAYDRHCLTVGGFGDAAYEWYAPYRRGERRVQCRMAKRVGYRAMVIETRGDVLGDTYRNDRAMVRLVVAVGRAECARY